MRASPPGPVVHPGTGPPPAGSIAAAPQRALRVGGLVPFSAADWPGRIAIVVFLRGCPWRCAYCHNPHLLDAAGPAAGWGFVRRLLRRRAGLVDAVVFSGGEPTSDAALGEAMAEARSLGFAVGLHTAGPYPRRLAEVLPLADWVGFDVKAPFASYERVTGVAGSGERAQASLETLLASGRAYEARTTWHPDLLGADDVRALAGDLALRGVRRFALQAFRRVGARDSTLREWREGPPLALLAELAERFPEFTYRPPQ